MPRPRHGAKTKNNANQTALKLTTHRTIVTTSNFLIRSFFAKARCSPSLESPDSYVPALRLGYTKREPLSGLNAPNRGLSVESRLLMLHDFKLLSFEGFGARESYCQALHGRYPLCKAANHGLQRLLRVLTGSGLTARRGRWPKRGRECRILRDGGLGLRTDNWRRQLETTYA